jgi:aldehyde:ferredoxin oxidoreductase
MGSGSIPGKLVHVDLGKSAVEIRKIRNEMLSRFLGGLGLCIRLIYEYLQPGVHPLSSDNVLVIGAGALVGTDTPGASRVYTLTKLPANGAVGWSGGGGVTFGFNLKSAGYDCIVITGKAEKPVYLRIEDENIEICDAAELWGSGTTETCNLLWEEHGRGGIISIGQAGENLVKFSMAYIDRLSTLGRGGVGAVFGSKNLKAIFVRGSQGVEVADRKRFRKVCDELLTRIREYPYLKEWQELGLVKSLPFIPKNLYLKLRKRRIACISCPVGDKEIIEIDGVETYTSSIVNLLTPVIMGMDYRDSIKLVAALDEYGMDTFEFLGVLELVRDNIEVDPDIDFSSLDSMLYWAEKIAFRRDFGNKLAEGTGNLVKELNLSKTRSLIKGLRAYVTPSGFLTWNLFGTMELGQLLDPRGPHVGSGGSPTYFAKRSPDRFRKHLLRMGIPVNKVDEILRDGINIGKLLCYSHTWFTILGSLGVCARAQINRFYSAKICAELYSAATGINVTVQDLMRKARNAWSLLRFVNVREGFSMEDDMPPDDWFGKSPFREYVSERALKKGDVLKMIREYYEEMGWSIDGVPRHVIV